MIAVKIMITPLFAMAPIPVALLVLSRQMPIVAMPIHMVFNGPTLIIAIFASVPVVVVVIIGIVSVVIMIRATGSDQRQQDRTIHGIGCETETPICVLKIYCEAAGDHGIEPELGDIAIDLRAFVRNVTYALAIGVDRLAAAALGITTLAGEIESEIRLPRENHAEFEGMLK
jgi:hypothetical protein